MKKNELVSPGGSLEKIEYAFHFGADAAYVGMSDFSLRARINDFDEKKLAKAVALARSLGKKIYFTLNIYAHERHLAILKKHLKFIAKIKPDAVIVSDPGILNLLKKYAPRIKIHLSTQANTTNSEAVKFWQKQGVKRIILAREVTLDEIKKIKKACPGMELEYFVHGAMCMSMSGRCLLSSWMRGRSANLGDCIQPCRWKYHLQEFPISNFQFPNKSQSPNSNGRNYKRMIVEENEHGTHIFNSKDLCLIEHLDELAKAGVNSFKIEGRTKSAYYVVCATRAYRQVLDMIESKKSRSEIKRVVGNAKKELEKMVNRGYSTGFLFGKDKWENDFEKSRWENKWQFVGEVIGGEKNDRIRSAKSPTLGRGAPTAQFNRVKVKIHNALKMGEKVEIITPDEIYSDKIGEIVKIGKVEEEKVISAHGGSGNIYYLKLKRSYQRKSLLRKRAKPDQKG